MGRSRALVALLLLLAIGCGEVVVGYRNNVVGPPAAVTSRQPVFLGNIVNGQQFMLQPTLGISFINQDNPSGPTIYDYGQSGVGNVGPWWGQAYPNAASNPVANTYLRNGTFQALGSSTVNGPTPYVNTFYAGNHYGVGSNAGQNVNLTVQYTTPGAAGSRLWTSYWSFYTLNDYNWWYTTGASQATLTLQATAGSNVLTTTSDISLMSPGGSTMYAYSQNSGSGLIPTGIDVNFINTLTPGSPNQVVMTQNATVSGPVNITFIADSLDNNNKNYDAGYGIGIYGNGSSDFYTSFGGVTTNQTINGTIYTFSATNSNTSPLAKIAWDDNYSPAVLQNPDEGGQNNTWRYVTPNGLIQGVSYPLFSTGVPYQGWVKTEIFGIWSDVLNGPGRFQWYEFNSPSQGPGAVGATVGLMNYTGRNVSPIATTNTFEAIGGFARNQGPTGSHVPYTSANPNGAGQYTNWRYFGDILFNVCPNTPSFARIVFSNSPTWSRGNGAFDEISPWTGWTPGSNGQIIGNFRAGNLQGGLVYAFYVDEYNGVPATLLGWYNFIPAATAPTLRFSGPQADPNVPRIFQIPSSYHVQAPGPVPPAMVVTTPQLVSRDADPRYFRSTIPPLIPNPIAVRQLFAAPQNDPNVPLQKYWPTTKSLPVITTTSLPSATVGSSYVEGLSVTGGVPPYGPFSVASFTPNTGGQFTFNTSTGVITGTPTTAETETLTGIEVVDSVGQPSAPTNLTLIVSPAGGATFTYYVSPTGNDANAGTVSAPWAITSLSMATWNTHNLANWNKLNGTGASVGFMPGTYDVSSMVGSQESNGAIQLPGGTSSTPAYYASCNSLGQYSPRTATLDMKGASGLYGGHVGGSGSFDGPLIAHTGAGPPSGNSYTVGNIIIDGLIITGFSYKGIRIGAKSSGDGPAITGAAGTCVVQNCELTGGSANAGDGLDNYVALWIDGTLGCCIVQNNYIHDNISWHVVNGGSDNMDHLTGLIVWGFGTSNTGTIIQNNTIINAGNLYGKEGGVQGTTVRYNYVDVSMYTSGAYGISDFTGNAQGVTGLTQPSFFYNNIVLSSGFGIQGVSTLSNSNGWETATSYYNNTIIMSGGSGALYTIAQSTGAADTLVYNNIYSGSASGFKTNPSAPGIWDYNLYIPSGMVWTLFQNASLGSQIATYTTPSAFAAAILANGGTLSGAESHSVSGTPSYVGGSPTFPAQKYQLNSGSPGKGAGSTTGTTGGSACDMGAWGGASPPSQIGCNFT